MTETENLKLALPGNNDYVDVEVLNENSKKIDTFAKNLNDSKGAASGLATLDAGGKIPSEQLPGMDYASSKHASQHAIGGNDPISPESIGAAPGAYVEAILNIPAGTEDPAALLDNLLDAYIAKKRDKSAGFVCLATSVAHPVLGGLSYIIKVNVINQNHVSLEAVSYYTTGTRRFTRSKYGGWGDWIPEANFSTITYVGTGTHGNNNKNSVTFPDRPKMVFVSGPNSAVFPGTAASGTVNSDGYDMLPFSWSGSTLSWYNAQGADYQLNESGVTYTCLALYL